MMHSINRMTLPTFTIAVLLSCGSAIGMTKTAATPWKTECVGYYTLQTPSELQYALQPQPFSKNVNATFDKSFYFINVAFRIKTDRPVADDGIKDTVRLMQAVSPKEFSEFKDLINKTLQTEKDELTKDADETEIERAELKANYARKAARINLHQSYSNNGAMAAVIQQIAYKQTTDGQIPSFTPALDFYVQVDQMTINATRKLDGTPQQTIDKFMSHFRSRAAFEVPTIPGVCLPYAFMSGEVEPADTGTAMRLKDRPDILIYLRDVQDYSKAYTPNMPVLDAKTFVNIRAKRSFNHGDDVEPLDKLFKSPSNVTVDGRTGAGSFVKITRKPAAGTDAINNEATKNEDWGYLAYIPADKKAPAGTSSDLIFRVERFSRFAKQPMTEKEFRALTMQIVQSIKRRSGAWVAPL
jgi:hypothetical protein